MGLFERSDQYYKCSIQLKATMENNLSSDTAGRKITLVGALVNAILIVLKLLAGVFGKSSALIADGVHSISDLFTDVVVLVGIWRGRKPADEDHPFGHGRIETKCAHGCRTTGTLGRRGSRYARLRRALDRRRSNVILLRRTYGTRH